jgi:hypothetical protein
VAATRRCFKRLEDPATRKKISDELHQRGESARTLLVGMRRPNMKPLIGKTLTEVAGDARQRMKSRR